MFMTSHEALDKSDIMQAVAELRDQLNELCDRIVYFYARSTSFYLFCFNS
ncbi:hypothetical protein N665_0674s0023 [Sinapis alba]|nr:hypothetical protein N665_0674s0023 [Sinapis alba]